jgi:Xaa-Pro aminopeptidase
VVGNADSIISGLRLIKDRSEVRAIKQAGVVTGEALHAVVALLTPGTQEREVAAMIDHLYHVRGATPAFGTIVATGVSAATLHYHRLDRAIRKGDFVLIDTGVELGMYASDVTRTIPVGEISEAQATIYEAVLAAQRAAIKKIRNNVLIRDLYLAAAREITHGLKEVGVLKGNIASLIKKEAFKRYFPHGIGHSLGIDVHDVGGLRGTQDATLSEGVVFTIEPGVYLPKPTKHLPALGIRIEDDVLVGRSGCTVLTDKVFPKELSRVAELLAKPARF